MTGRASDDGLTLANGRRVAWDDVYHIEWTAKAALVACVAGVVRVSRADGEAIERRTAPWEAQRDAWAAGASEEQRRHWAALPEGDMAVSKQRWGPTVGAASMLLFAGLLGALGLVVPFIRPVLLMEAGLFALFGVWLWRFSVGPDIARDTAGLTFGRRRPHRLLWSELRDCGEILANLKDTKDPSHLMLLTRRGRRSIPRGYRDGQALRDGLRAALAERAEALPATGAGWFAPSLWRPGQGLWLDDDGLVLVQRRRSQRFTWAELRPPVWHAWGAKLRAGNRTLKLVKYANGQRLAEAIDQRLAADTELLDADGELRREVIERWLGVPPGGALRCGLQRWKVWGCGLIVAGMIGTIALTHFASGLLSNVFIYGWLFVTMLRSARSIQADAQGLSVRRGRRREYYAWSDILAVEQKGFDWRITTRQGVLRLATPASGQDKVIGIIKRLLAMRERGLVLPGDAPLPETALSRLGAARPESLERGLSVSREEGE
jgi:hypothetical protein